LRLLTIGSTNANRQGCRRAGSPLLRLSALPVRYERRKPFQDSDGISLSRILHEDNQDLPALLVPKRYDSPFSQKAEVDPLQKARIDVTDGLTS
jgi:hypothetical protein